MTTQSLGGRRRSGILLHPSSLPGGHGIGDLGRGARDFADFLAAAGQGVWQVLPLAPTGYGDSPYQGLGAHGGNPLLVALEPLVEEGLLDAGELAPPDFPEGRVEFERVIPWKLALLARAAARFDGRAAAARRRAFEEFRHGAPGLERLALFLALKARAGGQPWWRWPAPLAACEPAAVAEASRALDAEVRGQAFAQFLFAEQWAALRAHCRERGVLLVGDLPIYVALDSVDVWARRELFELDPGGLPVAVAGVPPDYFSADGQRWGNPLYRWDVLARDGFRFFVDRVRAGLAQVDVLRVDHFRGFEAYWAIPADAPTAREGEWRPGPGAPFFELLRLELGDPLPLIAENLGVITPAVEAIRRRFGMPGMAILQFAFGTDPQAPTFLPHNYERDLVAYSGTHDNDTILGWWASEGGDSVRTPEQIGREKARALAYLRADGREMNWTVLATLAASVADTVIFPLQDVLGLGSEGRMNRPSTASGNWRWRCREGVLPPTLAERLGELTARYGRC
jgi:4-alpha-glucanotransferase